jgi:low affinity Fe/Cu permease
MTRRGRL